MHQAEDDIAEQDLTYANRREALKIKKELEELQKSIAATEKTLALRREALQNNICPHLEKDVGSYFNEDGSYYKCNVCDATFKKYPPKSHSDIKQEQSKYRCSDCGKIHPNGDAIEGCNMVYGRRGWRQLGVYDG